MKKKFVIGLVAAVVLVGASVFAFSSAGNMLKGNIINGVDCTKVSKNLLSVQVEFVKESTAKTQDFYKLEYLVSTYNVLKEKEVKKGVKEVVVCKIQDYAQGQYDTMSKKLEAIRSSQLGPSLLGIAPSVSLDSVFLTDKNEEIAYYKDGVVISKIKVAVYKDSKLDSKYKYKLFAVQGNYSGLGVLEMFKDMTRVKEYPFTKSAFHDYKTNWYSFILVGYLNDKPVVSSKILTVY
ncbi:MAG: hypothetical protein UT33_C0011G0176 [Candidatus Peregrinibacteria bacterium GW2011_GWC2_39_14]|nr:MAG: hypothetical protein UT33_C0011G0176 [Candidatus Peregrinibacteria bacterium GW2011_GWC2_39_14]